MHRKTQLVSSLGAAFALSLMASSLANASSITYDFTVTAAKDGSPLGGTTENGMFSYNSSSIVPGGSNVSIGLLTSLSFSWNGITYDQTTANTGFLIFDVSGNLVRAVFGNDCLGGCIATPSTNTWFINLVPPGGDFSYAVLGNDGLFAGSITAALAVPEPSTLVLLSLGCALVGTARRSRRNDIRGSVR